MAGTTEGGKKAAQTNRARYGDGTNGKEDFYTKIGGIGGRISRGGGFAMNRDLAVEAGRRGGKASRRTKANS